MTAEPEETEEIDVSAENAREQIEQWAAILSMIESPFETATYLRRIAAEIATMQPAPN